MVFIKGFFLQIVVPISLLQYANDAIFFGEWSRANALNLIHIFICFELASGLKVNIDKSRVMGVGVPANEVVFIASSIGCTHDSLPFYYLGLPVWKRMNSRVAWNEIDGSSLTVRGAGIRIGVSFFVADPLMFSQLRRALSDSFFAMIPLVTLTSRTHGFPGRSTYAFREPLVIGFQLVLTSFEEEFPYRPHSALFVITMQKVESGVPVGVSLISISKHDFGFYCFSWLSKK
nr:RNA-directed DNA polymerase, eukaryota, reverse transcriptase zinc-binding domain protein [Tanacetum cinerariifolium]